MISKLVRLITAIEEKEKRSLWEIDQKLEQEVFDATIVNDGEDAVNRVIEKLNKLFLAA